MRQIATGGGGGGSTGGLAGIGGKASLSLGANNPESADITGQSTANGGAGGDVDVAIDLTR